MGKTVNILNASVAVVSILGGAFVVYQSTVLIYNYHFSSALYYYMLPMDNLLSLFLFGVCAVLAGYFLLRRSQFCMQLYHILGTGLVFFPVNLLMGEKDTISLLASLLSLFLGLSILVYFSYPPILKSINSKNRRRSLLIGLVAGLGIAILPAILFLGYGYR